MANRSRFKNLLIVLPFLLMTSALMSACTSWLPEAHRQDIVQGNEIKPEMLKQIRLGMNKAEITPLIGNPTLKDPFHANRWDYIYRYISGHNAAEQSRLTLHFDGNTLIKIDDSDYKDPESLIKKEEE